MSANDVEPATPYSHAKPYSSSAELNAPRRKYLSAASFEVRSCRCMPARTYTGIVISSSPTNSVMRSVDSAMVIAPTVEKSTVA